MAKEEGKPRSVSEVERREAERELDIKRELASAWIPTRANLTPQKVTELVKLIRESHGEGLVDQIAQQRPKVERNIDNLLAEAFGFSGAGNNR